jgi:hypothetical protein
VRKIRFTSEIKPVKNRKPGRRKNHFFQVSEWKKKHFWPLAVAILRLVGCNKSHRSFQH